MRIVVTGGAGFVGSHLCDVLLGEGHSVLCVDNFFSGQQSNIKHLLSHERFELREHDVIQPLEVDGDVDQIYHLACPASPLFYQKDPIYTSKTAVLGCMNLLELARAKNARILYTSTSEVYGDPLEHPQTESYKGNVNPHGIRSCYDEGKRMGESLFFDYHRFHGVDIRVCRLFNSYGSRMRIGDGRVVSNFVVQALRRQPLTVYGSGDQTRSFCFSSDTVAGIRALMNTEDFTGPVNIGNPNERTIRSLAELVTQKVAAVMNQEPVAIVSKPLPADDPTRRMPNISLAKEKMNWEPTIDLEVGLDSTIMHFKEVLAAELE
eukprot:TRINITY_DN5140_c0_g1_i1.p1 TRINITY_DN5140_c0_g1~~TRINITY_DN5140_c0_g1_i1.p1  ORF type:complete len:321 (+),score=97.27 TRINITY_DN5140_c0_g1_i1:91-1053(+)